MIYTDTEIRAYITGAMAVGKAKQLEADMDASAELTDRVAEAHGERLPIKEAFNHELQSPVPASLQNLLATQSTQSTRKNVIPTRVMAICVAVGLFCGALFLLQFGPNERTLQSDAAGIAGNSLHEDWVERVADYQSLYTENTVGNPKPDAAATAQALLSRISARTSLKTALPDLSAHGYRFARAQELGFNGEALVQLVYSKPGSAPLAFCYMKSTDSVITPVKQRPFHQLNSASWQSDGQQYVLVAEENSSTLSTMSDSLRAYF